MDFAASASTREVRFAFLEACRLGLFDRRDVEYCFRRISGRRGAAKLKPLLPSWVPELKRTRSVLEGLFLLAWAERGLKMPRVNEKVFGREVDGFWPDEKLVLELDGGAFHSDPISRQRDLEKTRYLIGKGLRVVRVTYREFEADPDRVVDHVASQLELS